jgi:hypothetical protein
MRKLVLAVGVGMLMFVGVYTYMDNNYINNAEPTALIAAVGAVLVTAAWKGKEN